jgi:hypothetical protein
MTFRYILDLVATLLCVFDTIEPNSLPPYLKVVLLEKNQKVMTAIL